MAYFVDITTSDEFKNDPEVDHEWFIKLELARHIPQERKAIGEPVIGWTRLADGRWSLHATTETVAAEPKITPAEQAAARGDYEQR